MQLRINNTSEKTSEEFTAQDQCELLYLKDELSSALTQMSEETEVHQNLSKLVATVEEFGNSQAILSIAGDELLEIAPSFESGDYSGLTEAMEVANEGFVDTVKTVIARILAFLKKLFTGRDKLIDKTLDLYKKLDVSKIDESKFEGMRILGYSDKETDKLQKVGEKVEEFLKKAAADLVDKQVSPSEFDIKALNDFTDAHKASRREVKTIKEHGFDKSYLGEVVSHLEAIKKSKNLEDVGKKFKDYEPNSGHLKNGFNATTRAMTEFGKYEYNIVVQCNALVKAGIKAMSSSNEEKKQSEK